MADALIENEPFVRGKPANDKHSSNHSLTFLNVAESQNALQIECFVQMAAKLIGHKQLTKGTLLGFAQECVELVNYDNPDDSNKLTYDYA